MKTSRFLINGIVNTRSHKRLLNKGKLLAAALPIGLAFASPAVFAADAANGATTGSVPIDSNVFVGNVISSKTFVVPAGTTLRCVAVGSADIDNPAGEAGVAPPGPSGSEYKYEFAILRNNSVINGSRRTVELTDNVGVEDEDSAIASTSVFFSLVGNALALAQTISFAGQVLGASPSTDLTDSSFAVMCFDNLL